MKRRQINREYLIRITSPSVKDSPIDAFELAKSIEHFAKEHLEGILTVKIEGSSMGKLMLKLPVVSYMIRLIAEAAVDEAVNVTIILDEEFTVKANFPTVPSLEDTIHLINVAKLSGFEVRREGNVFFYSTPITISPIMQVYAISGDEIMDLLITTYNM